MRGVDYVKIILMMAPISLGVIYLLSLLGEPQAVWVMKMLRGGF